MYKVLIVDDEPWARKVIIKLGQWEKYNIEIVGEASDGGVEGMEMIDHHKPHIVITDMRMPGLDGTALLKRVNESHRDIKIIAMSGYNDFIYLKQAVKSSAVDYLLKPVDPAELNAALRRSVERLKQEKSEGLSGFGTLHLFEDEAVMNEYLKYRQRIFETLVGQQANQLDKLMDELCQCLSDKVQNRTNEMITKIGHDFIQMLQEYMVREVSEFYEIWKKSYLNSLEAIEDVRNFDDTFELVKVLYISSITGIIEMKQKKKNT